MEWIQYGKELVAVNNMTTLIRYSNKSCKYQVHLSNDQLLFVSVLSHEGGWFKLFPV